VRTSQFDYHLPKELVAQSPLDNRHDSRLLVFDRQSNCIHHAAFLDLRKFLNPGDLLVINNTRVIPARIYARKESGGVVEVLLLKKIDMTTWQVLIGGKNVSKGKILFFKEGLEGAIIEALEGANRIIQFNQPIDALLHDIGIMPLPPYIHKKLENPERYQTIYAQNPGSAAAPTAGLHFTKFSMQNLRAHGINFAEITLHVGLDTFLPVTEENIEDHTIHSEWCEVTPESAELINKTRNLGKRIVAVGTTTARTLESAAVDGIVKPYSNSTCLFITPGYRFQIIDAMLTNFHLPQSTLLMMVSAFAGLENVMKCYREAIDLRYRFYSFGDAMLIR